MTLPRLLGADLHWDAKEAPDRNPLPSIGLQGSRRMRVATIKSVAITLMALGALGVAAAPAGAKPYAPTKGHIYSGVSDTGSKQDYLDFTEAVGRHVPVLQAFEPWGGLLKEAKQRWKRTETRGMLSISTSPCYECAEVISPRSIAKGRGDGYLIRLNRFLVDWKRPTYIRLLPEMNGYWNPYAAFNSDGSARDPAHKTKQFRRAWRRVVLILRGGKRGKINKKLRAQSLPKLKRGQGAPKRLQSPEVSFLWVPQTHGSPRIKKNRPAAYWPGGRFVDWVGADIYGKFPNFEGLDRFYRARKGFPFVIGEWSPWDSDNPGFVDALHEWAESHRRTKMLVYFQGFGDNNPFMIQRYPASAAALSGQLDNKRYQRFAPHSRRPGKKGPDEDGGVTPKG